MSVTGMDALIKRMEAIGEPQPVLRALQFAVIHEAQALAPRRTGNLQRSIVPGQISGTRATVNVNANYARYVEEGTGLYGPKHHRIEPGHVMHWKGAGKGVSPGKVLRLSGRSRVVGGRSLASDVFAMSTTGAKAQPYLLPGAKRAVEGSGLKDVIVKLWNEAA